MGPSGQRYDEKRGDLRISLSFYLDNWVHKDAINLEHRGGFVEGNKFCLGNLAFEVS